MTEALPRYGIAALTLFTATILERAGLREADAEVSADILVTSDVYGSESHGIARLGYYVNLIAAGLIDVEASPVVERETAVTAVVDARNGFGPPAARLALAGCLEKAQRAGLAMVTVRNSNHFGIARYYAMMAAREGLVGMAATNAGPQVVLGGTRSRPPRPSGLGHFFAAWRPDAFRPREEFLADVDDLIRSLSETAPGQTGGAGRVAGELEFAAEQDRRVHGVPIHPCVAVELEQIALKMAVPFPKRAGVHA